MVTLLSCEAEYMAITKVKKEVLQYSQLLKTLEYQAFNQAVDF